MIGDGMGLTQISAALYRNKKGLHLEKMPVVGLQKTRSADNLVTDSGAAATAMACGRKTYNFAIGLDAGSAPCQTILETMKASGYATGLVVTSPITHATPAAFYAHQPNRVYYEDIAADLVKAEVDFFVGGGKRYFDNRESDNSDLIQELKWNGYSINTYLELPLQEAPIPYDQRFGYFTADTKPLPVTVGRSYLPYASQLGARFLERFSKKGFFMMIEGSQIDWGGHGMDSEYLINEMLDFDRALGNILSFAKSRGNTLVIVTGDHECGGYAINPGSTRDEIQGAFTTNGHTATMIPVFAYGPGSHLFAGVYDNTAIHSKIKEALALDNTQAQR